MLALVLLAGPQSRANASQITGSGSLDTPGLPGPGGTMRKGHLGIVVALALGLIAGQQSPANAGLMSGAVSLDTSGLSGPFELAFVFIDGSGLGDANNSVMLSAFQFGLGGSAGTVDTILSTGGESGDMGSTVSLIDSSFLNIFASTFTPGNQLAFAFSLTTNVDSGGTPDQLSLVLLRSDGSVVDTSDPSGNDSLLTVNIDSGNPRFDTFASDLNPAPVVTEAVSVPEPSSLLLLVLGVALVRRRSQSAELDAALPQEGLTECSAATAMRCRTHRHAFAYADK